MSGPGLARYLTTGVYSLFELMVRVHGRSPTSSFLLSSLFSDTLGVPQGAYIVFLRPMEWEAAAGRIRCSAAFGIRPQDILLRFTNRRPYIGPDVQQYLASLDAEWEERLTRWILGVQNAPKEGVTLSLFPVGVAASPRGTGLVLASDQMAGDS